MTLAPRGEPVASVTAIGDHIVTSLPAQIQNQCQAQDNQNMAQGLLPGQPMPQAHGPFPRVVHPDDSDSPAAAS